MVRVGCHTRLAKGTVPVRSSSRAQVPREPWPGVLSASTQQPQQQQRCLGVTVTGRLPKNTRLHVVVRMLTHADPC